MTTQVTEVKRSTLTLSPAYAAERYKFNYANYILERHLALQGESDVSAKACMFALHDLLDQIEEVANPLSCHAQMAFELFHGKAVDQYEFEDAVHPSVYKRARKLGVIKRREFDRSETPYGGCGGVIELF